MKQYLSKLTFLVLLIQFFSQHLSAQAPVIQVWDKTIGGGSYESLTSLISSEDGGYLIGGSSASGAGGDKTEPNRSQYGDGTDYWIMKINSEGTIIWGKTYGGGGADYLQSIVKAADGGYLLGGWSQSGADGDKTEQSVGLGDSDYWVVKLNSDGSKAWDKTIGGRNFEMLYSVTAVSDGGYLLGGYSRSGADGQKSEGSRGRNDYWVVKLDSEGVKVWDKRFGGSSDEFLASIISTSDGGFLLAGSSGSGTGDDKSHDSKGGLDYWVIKINSDGSKAWDKTYGGNSNDRLVSVIGTEDGGSLLGGYSTSGAGGDKTESSRGGEDYWVVKLTADGSKTWDKTIGGNKSDWFTSLSTTPDGGYLLGGSSESGVSGDRTEASKGEGDSWLVKLNPNGSKAWDKTIGGSKYDAVASLKATPDGGFLLGGTSASGAGGDKSQDSRGSTDYWMVKIKDGIINATTPEKVNPSYRLTVYPNPSSGSFLIKFPDLKPGLGPVELVLYSVTGQKLLRQIVKESDLNEGVSMQTYNLSSGTYYLQLHTQENILTEKVILY